MKYVFLGGAWPYANSSRHIGHLASSMLPADIYARYRRSKGDKVIFVSGSDAHGTPILIKANLQKTTPKKLVDYFHNEYLEQFIKLGISYNCFYRTDSQLHANITNTVCDNLRKNGYIDIQKSYVATNGTDTLPDRYIEGTCVYCKYEHARGDQCDSCGKLMQKDTLINAHSLLDKKEVQFKDQDNLFLKLTKFKESLESWFRNTYFNRSFINKGIKEQLNSIRDRSISREISWGIELDKQYGLQQRFYVWFDAVIGYLTASIAYGKQEKIDWKEWWSSEKSERYFFFGKDNLIFHSIFFPAILLGGGGGELPDYLSLPSDLIASEFFLEKKESTINNDNNKVKNKLKLSASRDNALNLKLGNLIDTYESDYIRYYLTLDGPENKDTVFDEEVFHNRINNELIAKWGNLWYRITSMIHNKHNGYVNYNPNFHEAQRLLDNLHRIEKTSNIFLDEFKFSQALKHIMVFVDELNFYISSKKPWSLTHKEAEIVLSNVLAAAIQCNRLFWPFIPFTSARVINHLFGINLQVNGRIERDSNDDSFQFLYKPLEEEGLKKYRYPSNQITPLLLYRKL